MLSNILIGRTYDFSVIYDFFKTVSAPTGNTGNCKNRGKQLLRNLKHIIYKAAVKVYVSANRLVETAR